MSGWGSNRRRTLPATSAPGQNGGLGGAPGAGHGRSRFAQRPEGGDYRTKALPDPDARPSVPLYSQRNLLAARRVPGPCASPELSIPPHSPLPHPWPILRACRLQAGLATSHGLRASPAPLLMSRRENWGKVLPLTPIPLCRYLTRCGIPTLNPRFRGSTLAQDSAPAYRAGCSGRPAARLHTGRHLGFFCS